MKKTIIISVVMVMFLVGTATADKWYKLGVNLNDQSPLTEWNKASDRDRLALAGGLIYTNFDWAKKILEDTKNPDSLKPYSVDFKEVIDLYAKFHPDSRIYDARTIAEMFLHWNNMGEILKREFTVPKK